MTQPSVPSDQAAPETVVPENDLDRTQFGSLVFKALQEFCANSIDLRLVRQKRAIDLFTRVAAGIRTIEDVLIFTEKERVFFEVQNDAITLEFWMGAAPEDDFFTIYDYMSLPHPRPIRSFHDLGCALEETAKVATQVLEAFRETLIGEIPLLVKNFAG